MTTHRKMATRVAALALALLLPPTAANCAAGHAVERPVPVLKGRLAAVEAPKFQDVPKTSFGRLPEDWADEYLNKMTAIVAASDPIADAALDAKKSGVAPLVLVWGYGYTPGTPGLKCETTDLMRDGHYIWGFGDAFNQAEGEFFFALYEYANAYNLELHKNGLISFACAPQPSRLGTLRPLKGFRKK